MAILTALAGGLGAFSDSLAKGGASPGPKGEASGTEEAPIKLRAASETFTSDRVEVSAGPVESAPAPANGIRLARDGTYSLTVSVEAQTLAVRLPRSGSPRSQ